MNDIQAQIIAWVYSERDSDPAICGCKGSGWFLSDYDTYEACPSHPGRAHPDAYHYGGRFPTLAVVDRYDAEVTVPGDISHATFCDDDRGLARAISEAKRLIKSFAEIEAARRDGWVVVVSWEVVEPS